MRNADHVELWKRARAMVGDTSRWPFIHWTTGDWTEYATGEAFDSKQFEYSDRGSHIEADVSVAGLLARTDALVLEQVLGVEERHEYKRKYIEDDVQSAHVNTAERWGTAPPEAEIEHAARAAADPELGIERFLFTWELAQGLDGAKTREVEWALDHMQPMPPPFDPSFLVLLPTHNPWEVFAYVEGLWNRPSDRLINAARLWHTTFGAEVVAIFSGSSTVFRVARRPVDVAVAWELARQHWLLAPDTLMLPGTRLRDYVWAPDAQRLLEPLEQALAARFPRVCIHRCQSGRATARGWIQGREIAAAT